MEQAGIWWKAVSYGLPVLEIVLMGCCLYGLAAPFMGKISLGEGNFQASGCVLPKAGKKRIRLEKGAAWTGGAYILVMCGIYAISLLGGGFPLRRMMGALAVFLVMCRTDRRNYGQKAFLVQAFFSLHRFAGAVAEMIYDNLYYIIGNTDYMEAHPDLSFALYAGVCTVYLAAELLFMGVSVWFILRTYVYRYAEMSIKELLVLMTPSFLGVAGYWVIWHYRNFYIMEIQRNSNVYDMLSLFYYIVAMITIVAVIALYQSIKAGQEEKLQNKLLAVQMEDIRRHIEQVENLYQDIRGIRHDMANHIVTLERLYEVEKAEEAKTYGAQLKTALFQPAEQMKSGNPVTDVILLGVKTEAERRGIEFRSEFHYPAGSHIDAFDISVVLNNALQNALENVTGNRAEGNADDTAAREEKTAQGAETDGKPYIRIRSYHRNNAYMIEIRNSFTGNLQWDAQSGLPMTSKGEENGFGAGKAYGNEKGGRDGQVHGYGLANIRRVAGKYSGDIAIDLQDEEFRLSIMLMME